MSLSPTLLPQLVGPSLHELDGVRTTEHMRVLGLRRSREGRPLFYGPCLWELSHHNSSKTFNDGSVPRSLCRFALSLPPCTRGSTRSRPGERQQVWYPEMYHSRLSSGYSSYRTPLAEQLTMRP